MDNKKNINSRKKISNGGYTLVELLAMISLLSIISVIVIYTSTAVVEKANNKSFKVTINEIEKTAGIYAIENSSNILWLDDDYNIIYQYQCVTVQNLIDKGYFDNNILNSKIDKNKNISSTDYVYVEKNRSTKTITRSVLLYNNPQLNGLCGVDTLADGIIEFNIPSGFAKSKEITITYTLKSSIGSASNYKYSYGFDADNSSDKDIGEQSFNFNTKNKIVKKIIVNDNGWVFAKIDKLDNTNINNSNIYVDGIDTNGPVITSNATSTTVRGSVVIPVIINDIGSGIKGDSINLSDFKVSIGNKILTENFTFEKVSSNLNTYNYNLKIENYNYEGEVNIVIDKDRILDNLGNGNVDTVISTGVIFSNKYTISYNANGGSGTMSDTGCTYDGNCTLRTNSFTRAGYTFNGWNLKKDGTGSSYADQESVKNLTGVDGKTITLYAQWKASVITITFDSNGGLIDDTEYMEETLITTVGQKQYIVPKTGEYKLEVWGAQGATYEARGGYGGYSVGTVNLEAGTILYANVGGKGSGGNEYEAKFYSGGYNGGGTGIGSGGGATHIATASGELKNLSSNKNAVLIVAGGGGGAYYGGPNSTGQGGDGGGYKGVAGDIWVYGSCAGSGASQTAGGSGCGYGVGSFGKGGSSSDRWGSAGGGGWYGGGASPGLNDLDEGYSPGGGGSGYIGNSLLSNKAMYCYNCSTSTAANTLTYSTTNVSSTPTAKYAKSGNGAVKITMLTPTKKVTNGSPYGTLPTSSREGYIFVGWNTKADGTGEMITSNTIVNLSGDTTLYAVWKSSNNICTVGTTYENCLLNENRPSSLWTSTLTNDGYRFVGTKSSPPNNYICFGTTSSSTCTGSPDTYMYRIIGIFQEGGTKYLKLIKNSKVGGTHEIDNNFNSDNRWSRTTLYSSINGSGFLNNTTYVPNSSWKNKIISRTWVSADTDLNGYNSSGVRLWTLTPAQIYCFEHNISSCKPSGGVYTSSSAKIGLMYVSDYALSLGSSAATTSSSMEGYKSTLKTGWMYNYTNFSNSVSGVIEWTMTRGGYPVTGLTNARFYGIRLDGYSLAAQNRYGAEHRPVFYMPASQKYAGGLGTASKPFIIVE